MQCRYEFDSIGFGTVHRLAGLAYRLYALFRAVYDFGNVTRGSVMVWCQPNWNRCDRTFINDFKLLSDFFFH